MAKNAQQKYRTQLNDFYEYYEIAGSIEWTLDYEFINCSHAYFEDNRQCKPVDGDSENIGKNTLENRVKHLPSMW